MIKNVVSPPNKYMLKDNNRNTKKGVKHVHNKEINNGNNKEQRITLFSKVSIATLRK